MRTERHKLKSIYTSIVQWKTSCCLIEKWGCDVQSGDLDTLFDVLERTDQKNTGGQVKQEWNQIGQFYGGVEPISIQTFVQSGVQGSALVCRVVMRPDDFPQIKPKHMIKNIDTNEVYVIEGVLPVNKGKWSLMCKNGAL